MAKNRWPDRQTLDINHTVLTDIGNNIDNQLQVDVSETISLGWSNQSYINPG